MRSFLLVNSETAGWIAQARLAPADALILAVRADPNSLPALMMDLRQAKQNRKIFVAISALSDPNIAHELACIMSAAPDGIVLPKSLAGRDVQHLSAKLSVAEAENGLVDGATQILAMAANSGHAIFGLSSYAATSARLCGLTWDQNALAQNIGADPLAAPVDVARAMLIFAAAAAQVQAVDGAELNTLDAKSFRTVCEQAKRNGFTGKIARTVEDVAIINDVFADH